MDIKKLLRLSLPQLEMMLGESSEKKAHVFIGRNVGVVRRAVPRLLESIRHQPLMLEEMRVLIVKRGESHPVINLLPLDVHAGDLVFVAKNSTVELHDFSPDIEGEGFSMSDEVFRLVMGATLPSSLDGRVRNFKISLKADELNFLTRIIDMIYDITSRSDYNSRVFLSLAATFWWYVDSLYKQRLQSEATGQNRDQLVFSKFMALVNEHARREHNLAFYADRLLLSVRYMGTVVRKVSGRSAKDWIDEALITAIKVEMHHTSKPLKQIADEMRFANMSFFSKFFKRMTGLTPMQYCKDARV